jgi:UDP:flavonoid glycosyltransferase YjiC (YdhE family)
MAATDPPALAIVSLLPDTGHVVPLLRIGVAMARAGARVACFLPRACEGLRSQFPLELRPGGPRTSPETLALAGSFRHSRASWLTMGYKLRRYFAAIRYEASQALGEVGAALAAFAPDALLADPHGFSWWYRYLAQACPADLVLHASEGTLRRWQPPAVQARGLPPRDRVRAGLQALAARLEAAGAAISEDALVRIMPAGWPERAETLEHVARAIGLAPGAPERAEILRLFRFKEPDSTPVPGAWRVAYREHAITTGVAALEASEARAALIVPDDVARFGPLPGAAAALPGELARWIEGAGGASGAGRVVYVSFGTMLRVDRRLARAMFDALARLRLRGLWAIPEAQARALGDLAIPPHVRIERHVPQASVLRRPEVVCCVTHAGAGTVQESLWAGKPMLCVPALWDQFYNASWVERRGAGLRLTPERARAGGLAAPLAALVERPSFPAAARSLQAAFEDARGAELVVAHLQAIAAARRARRRFPPR